MKAHALKTVSKLLGSDPAQTKRFIAAALRPHIDYLFQIAVYWCGNRFHAEELLREFLREIGLTLQKNSKVLESRQWVIRELYSVFIRSQPSEMHRTLREHAINSSFQSDIDLDDIDPQLHLVISFLPAKQRALLVLHDVEGLSLAEIGEIIHSPVELLSNRLRAARENIRKFLTEMEVFQDYEHTFGSTIERPCIKFIGSWNTQIDARENSEDQKSLREHILTCPGCQFYDWQMKVIVSNLGLLSRPEPLLQETKQNIFASLADDISISSGLLHGWPQVAAVFVAVVITGLLFWSGVERMTAKQDLPVVVMSVGVQQNVSLAFDSTREINDVHFTIELPEGIRLAGYPDTRQLSWVSYLEIGRNKLTLPLIIDGSTFDEDFLMAKIRYGDTEKILKVLLIKGYS